MIEAIPTYIPLRFDKQGSVSIYHNNGGADNPGVIYVFKSNGDAYVHPCNSDVKYQCPIGIFKTVIDKMPKDIDEKIAISLINLYRNFAKEHPNDIQVNFMESA